jgi:hypothetical protein
MRRRTFTNDPPYGDNGGLSIEVMQYLVVLFNFLGRRMPKSGVHEPDQGSVSSLERSQIVNRRSLFQPNRPLFRRVGRGAAK